tara:strand:+ start:2137 stop:2697 length:561 start_codon:yes stop_codon:yes gene_type:complete
MARTYSNMTHAKRARSRFLNLKVVKRELGGVCYPESAMRLTDMGPGGRTHGRAGMTGFANFASDANRETVEELVIHEMCHTVLYRIGHKQRRGHGQAFRGMLMAACVEFFKLTGEDEREILRRWEAKKRRQRAVNREMAQDHEEYGDPGAAPKLSRKHAYLLDSVIIQVAREKREAKALAPTTQER